MSVIDTAVRPSISKFLISYHTKAQASQLDLLIRRIAFAETFSSMNLMCIRRDRNTATLISTGDGQTAQNVTGEYVACICGNDYPETA